MNGLDWKFCVLDVGSTRHDIDCPNHSDSIDTIHAHKDIQNRCCEIIKFACLAGEPNKNLDIFRALP